MTMSDLLWSTGGATASTALGAPAHAVRHALTEHPLLQTDALAELADRLPVEHVEHNRGDLDAVNPDGQVTVLGRTPGEIARGIHENGCWMVLKNVEQVPAYHALLDEVLDAVAPAGSGDPDRHLQREAFVFMSAPNAVTPAHVDPEHNFLLQVSGTKTMNVGRFSDPDVADREIERTLVRAQRNITTKPDHEDAFALGPGDGVYVPPRAPHWVQNGPTVSISLSVTWRTLASERERAVYHMNTYLRRLHVSPPGPGRSPRLDGVRSGAFQLARRVRDLVR